MDQLHAESVRTIRSEQDLVKRCEALHDHAYVFLPERGVAAYGEFLGAYPIEEADINELKTLLVISKGMQGNHCINTPRQAILARYNALRN